MIFEQTYDMKEHFMMIMNAVFADYKCWVLLRALEKEGKCSMKKVGELGFGKEPVTNFNYRRMFLYDLITCPQKGEMKLTKFGKSVVKEILIPLENAFNIDLNKGKDAFVLNESGWTLFHCMCPNGQYFGFELLKKIAYTFRKYGTEKRIPSNKFYSKQYHDMWRYTMRGGPIKTKMFNMLCSAGIIRVRVYGKRSAPSYIKYSENAGALADYYTNLEKFVDKLMKEWQPSRALNSARLLVSEHEKATLGAIFSGSKTVKTISKKLEFQIQHVIA